MANGFNPAGMCGPAGRGFTQAVPQPPGIVLHITGQVALDADNQVVGTGDVTAQFHAAMANIDRILATAGGSRDDIVSLTVLFSDRNDLPAIQAVRSTCFRTPTAPVSITYQVAGFVYADHRIELVPIAVIPPDRYLDATAP